MGDRVILRLEDIVKTFPGVKALDGVKLDVKEGEVHALCGENGAGKSTLMKIIAGAQGYTSGHMYINDQEVVFHSTKEAEKMGIAMIYQEFNMVPEFLWQRICTLADCRKHSLGWLTGKSFIRMRMRF